MNAVPDLTMTAIKMVFALVGVLILVIALYYLAKRFIQNPIYNENEDSIKIISNKYIGIKKNLCLVEVPGALLLLGVTNEHISCLTKIEDKEVINNYRSEKKIEKKTFASHLHKMSSKYFKKNI
jgi:flagellar biosynthetic protein FliO